MSRFFSMMAVCILLFAASVSAQTTKSQTPADNTKVNQRDRNSANPTPGQQKENSSDLEITRKIRRSITEDKGLSTYAKNIKIITQDGRVTLRGPVRSEVERKSVEAKANEVAGAGHVKSEIQVAAKPTETKNH